MFVCVCVCGLLGWSEHRLQVLLNFVDVSEDVPLEGEERRVCPWRQVVKVSRSPNQRELFYNLRNKHVTEYYFRIPDNISYHV